MKLQVALDTLNTEDALALVKKLSGTADIVEVGTPMIIHYGISPVQAVRAAFPDLTILADTKIMDAGELESMPAFRAGAQIVTVMGITHDETIQGAVKAAERYGGHVMADMMCVRDLESRAATLVSFGVEYVCVHSAVDVQKTENPFGDLRRIGNAIDSSHCVIAGGINLMNLEKLPFLPEIVVVGSGITGASDPATVAGTIKKKLSKVAG